MASEWRRSEMIKVFIRIEFSEKSRCLNIPTHEEEKENRNARELQCKSLLVESRAFVGFLETQNRTACFASNVLCADYLRRPSVCGVWLYSTPQRRPTDRTWSNSYYPTPTFPSPFSTIIINTTLFHNKKLNLLLLQKNILATLQTTLRYQNKNRYLGLFFKRG